MKHKIPDPGWGPSTKAYLKETASAVRIDNYTRENWSALVVLDSNGHNEFNGVSKRTIVALSNRHLVWDKGDGRATLTDLGRAVLAELETEQTV